MRRLAVVLILANALVGLTFLIPGLNSLQPWHFDLAGPVAVAAFWVAASASFPGAAIVCAIMIALVIFSQEASWQRRLRPAAVMAGVLLLLLGGGAALNEHVLKPALAVQRPWIRELARTPPDSPALKITADEFYRLPDKAARSEYLTRLFTDEFTAYKLDDRVRQHWIAETGYSFPSGHAFAAWTIATFFLSIGMTHGNSRALWILYLLPAWAVLVCYSRTILRVHSPADVCAGAAAGILIGLAAYFLYRQLVYKYP